MSRSFAKKKTGLKIKYRRDSVETQKAYGHTDILSKETEATKIS